MTCGVIVKNTALTLEELRQGLVHLDPTIVDRNEPTKHEFVKLAHLGPHDLDFLHPPLHQEFKQPHVLPQRFPNYIYYYCITVLLFSLGATLVQSIQLWTLQLQAWTINSKKCFIVLSWSKARFFLKISIVPWSKFKI